ncbi:MAG: HAD-IIB family hydrolase [Deltaproteobacteria bacterium]|nr:HAD-IIB family hydrolase [Deltaproteobacteria bacterium]
MRPLPEMPRQALRGVTHVLTDIDDTLTDHGRLGAGAYTALERLTEAGVTVVPVTGRPAGWCDHIARMWPVGAVVGENGALYFRYDAGSRRMIRHFSRTEAQRREDRVRLQTLAREIPVRVPGSAVSADQAYRDTDLAIDFCEDVPPLPMAEAERIRALFEAAGARAKISSIHVNGWFGDFDKLSMTRTLFAREYGLDLDLVRDRVVFAGDSPNDSPMFAFFPLAVGVANVLDMRDRLEAEPAFVTPSRGGAGFSELAEALLTVR